MMSDATIERATERYRAILRALILPELQAIRQELRATTIPDLPRIGTHLDKILDALD
jgi:hypothetical protein